MIIGGLVLLVNTVNGDLLSVLQIFPDAIPSTQSCFSMSVDYFTRWKDGAIKWILMCASCVR